VVKLPQTVMAAFRSTVAAMRSFFEKTDAIKNGFRTPQEGERVLTHPAYLTPSPGWSELFEVRKSQRDPSYRFPPGTEEPCMRLFGLLRDLAMHSLGVLSHFVCADERTLPRLAMNDSGPSTMRCIHYDQVVPLAEQLSAIPPGTHTRRGAERKLMAAFPSHVDSSLVTIAPRATVSGLAVRDVADGRWLRVERQMAEDEAVLFGGDPLAFVSRHYFHAAMHRPDALEMARQAPATRITTPYFLYCDEEATLDASLCRIDDAAALTHVTPQRIPVPSFRLNVGNYREEWPWKAQPYYGGRVISRDSDAFPGLETEGDMEYAD
jgi:hypothetical protein